MSSQLDAAKYQQVLDDLQASSGDQRLLYPKAGRTRIVVTHEGDPYNFVVPVTRVFQGKESKKFGVKAFVPVEGEEGHFQEKFVVITKTVLEAILGYLAEGWTIIGEPGESWNGIGILRSGEALKTSYQVTPSPKTIEIPEDTPRLQESSLELAKAIFDRDSNRANTATNNSGAELPDEEESEW